MTNFQRWAVVSAIIITLLFMASNVESHEPDTGYKSGGRIVLKTICNSPKLIFDLYTEEHKTMDAFNQKFLEAVVKGDCYFPNFVWPGKLIKPEIMHFKDFVGDTVTIWKVDQHLIDMPNAYTIMNDIKPKGQNI